MRAAGRYVPGCVELKHGLCVEGEKLFGFADLQEEMLRPKVNIVGAVIEGRSVNQ
jgi:hypothetical protein